MQGPKRTKKDQQSPITTKAKQSRFCQITGSEADLFSDAKCATSLARLQEP